MPTGYTADVCDGKVADFKTFALRCARNFGALVMMREDPMDAPIPEAFQPSDYHDKEIEKAKAELERIAAMSWQECGAKEREARSEMLASHRRRVDECKAVRDRLMEMRSQVADWTPPTPDHEGLKQFMIEQIDSTIQFDCNPGTYYLDLAAMRTGQQWREYRMSELQQSLEYHTKERKLEIERTESRNRWLAELRKSL